MNGVPAAQSKTTTKGAPAGRVALPGKAGVPRPAKSDAPDTPSARALPPPPQPQSPGVSAAPQPLPPPPLPPQPRPHGAVPARQELSDKADPAPLAPEASQGAPSASLSESTDAPPEALLADAEVTTPDSGPAGLLSDDGLETIPPQEAVGAEASDISEEATQDVTLPDPPLVLDAPVQPFEHPEPDTLTRSSWVAPANGPAPEDDELEGPTTVMEKAEIAAALASAEMAAPTASQTPEQLAAEVAAIAPTGRGLRPWAAAAAGALLVLVVVGLFLALRPEKAPPLVTEETAGVSAEEASRSRTTETRDVPRVPAKPQGESPASTPPTPATQAAPTQPTRPASTEPADAPAPAQTTTAAPSDGDTAKPPPETDAVSAVTTDPEFQKQLGRLLHYVEECHKNGRRTGTATLKMSISPRGRVSKAEVIGEPLASAPVARCIVARARAYMLPAFQGDAIEVAPSFTLD